MAKKKIELVENEDRELDEISKKLDDMVDDMFLGEQPLDEEEKALLDLIYSRKDVFYQSNKAEHENADECREILHLRDPHQDDEKTLEANKGKPTLQLQTLKATFNNVVADQMLSMPEAKMIPETEDMQEAADELQDLVHHVIYVANDFEETHHRRCEDFYGPGTAIIETAWDPDMAYGRGDIAVFRWPIEAFLWDPMADNIQDCRAVMKIAWHPMSWYKEHYPKQYKYIGADDEQDIGKTRGQKESEHSDDEDRAMLIEYWWRTYNAKTHRYSINVAYAAGHALLEVHKNVYMHGLYPFTIDVHDHEEGKLTGQGLVSELVSMMRYINRYAAYADMNARMSSKGRLLVKKSAGIDKDALTDWTNDVIEGDSIQTDSIVWMHNQPFNSVITTLMTMLQSDLKADSGANQFTRGETTGGIVSGKAINSLIQAGSKIASMRTEQLKSGFKNIVEQIVWLMAQFYDDGRTVLITGKNKTITVDTKKLFGRTGKGRINPPPYTVQIEVSSRDPQRVANRNQMFMEAFTMAAQTPNPMRLSDLFRILNLDGKENILPVIEENEHYAEQMQAMQQQIEEMQAMLEQTKAENDNLRSMSSTMKNTLGNISKRGGNNVKLASPNSDHTGDAVVQQARNTLGLPTGADLPT